jgi:hypothetical protein
MQRPAQRQLRERNPMQTPNGSTKSKYDGPIEYLLAFCNAMELSQITSAQLEEFCAFENATSSQRLRLLGLWTGGQEVGAELLQVVIDICYPKLRDRLLNELVSR